MEIPNFFSNIYSYKSMFYIEDILNKLQYIKTIVPDHKICDYFSAFFLEITDSESPVISEYDLRTMNENMNIFYDIIYSLKELEILINDLKKKKISSSKKKLYYKLFQKQIDIIYSLNFKSIPSLFFIVKKEIEQEINFIKNNSILFSPSLSIIIEV